MRTYFTILFLCLFFAGCKTINKQVPDIDRGHIPDVQKPIKPPSLTNEWQEINTNNFSDFSSCLG